MSKKLLISLIIALLVILAAGGIYWQLKKSATSPTEPGITTKEKSTDQNITELEELEKDISKRRQPLPQATSARYPRLHANIYSKVPENEAAYDALSRYGAVTTGALYSVGSKGGYDLGVRQGVGSWADTTYDLAHAGRGGISQVTVYEAKKRNPELIMFAQRGLKHIPALYFEYGTNSPQRWWVDRLSPRWFAYAPLIELQEPVTRTSQLTFRFRPEDVQQWRDWGVKGGQELGLTHWRPSNRYDWYYLSFFDNEAGGGRGTVEIMAIQRLNAETGEVTVATKLVDGNPWRTIYGRPQKYPAGSRAGIVPHSAESFGAPAFLMNLYCLDDEPAGCEETAVDGVGWVDAAVEYVREILLPSRYPLGAPDETWLVDGVLMDADDDDWKPYGFPLAYPDYHLDLNLDGLVDDATEIEDRTPEVYEEYARRLKEAAASMGRDLLVIKNGQFSVLPRPYYNGRQFEDFNGGFQETYPQAMRQYVDLFTPGNLAEPIYVLVRERDRNALYEHNFDQHRHIMALTLVLGDGYYGHTGAHATRILALDEDPSGWAGQPEDWFDEFSVDPYGYAADHPLYTGRGRSDYLGWLGRALGPGYEASNVSGVYRRDFEHGVALYSLRGGTVSFNLPLRRICGVDPGNDGSLVEKLTLPAKSGVVLRRNENTGQCPSLPVGEKPKNNFGVYYFETEKLGALDFNIGFVRLVIPYGEIVDKNGVINWQAQPIKRIDQVLEKGIGVIPVIRAIQVNEEKGCSLPPNDLANSFNNDYGYSQSYYNFIKKIAEHYQGKFQIVVIENEVTADNFWCGTMDEYLRILATAKKAFKDTDPEVKIADSGIPSTLWGFLMTKEKLDKGMEKEAFDFYNSYFKNSFISKAKTLAELKGDLEKSPLRENIEKAEYLMEKLPDHVDIINFHYYEPAELYPELIAFIKKKTKNKPLMTNELGTRVVLDMPEAEREKRASQDMIEKLRLSKELKLEAVIWFSFNNDQHNIVGLLDENKKPRDEMVKVFNNTLEGLLER